MKHSLLLFVLCIFLISCNKTVHFFSKDDNFDDQSVIPNQKSADLFQKRVRARKKPRRRKKRFTYQQPPKEEMIILDGQVEFVQLASSDVQPVDSPVKKEISVSIVSNREGNNQQTIEPSSVKSISPINTSISLPASRAVMEISKERFNLKVKEKEIKIDVSVVQPEEKLNHPSIPPLQLNVAMKKLDKVFISRPLDILFVMDTSESMYQHLMNFKKKFAGFLQYFSSFDWKLAITDADAGDTFMSLFDWTALNGKAMKLERDGVELDLRYLHPGISDYDRIFLDSISQHREGEYTREGEDGEEDVGHCELPPYCQSYQEQPLKSLKLALGKNPDFFRKEADLVTIVISNSRERAGDENAATKPEEVIEQFKNVHGIQKRFAVYGIIITEGDTVCLKENIDRESWPPEGAFSEKIAALSKQTGGAVFSICSPDYQELSQSIFDIFGKAK